jgi:hypothetical protein
LVFTDAIESSRGLKDRQQLFEDSLFGTHRIETAADENKPSTTHPQRNSYFQKTSTFFVS